LGVAFGSAQTGLGEASLLALAGKTDANHNSNSSSSSSSFSKGRCLTSFSSGTGMAGVFGFFWKWWWNEFLGFSLSATLFLALGLAIGYWTTFRYATTQRGSFDDPDSHHHHHHDDYDEQCMTPLESPSSTYTDMIPPRETLSLEMATTTTTSPPVELTSGVLEIAAMTGGQRFRLVSSLWPYMVPLFVVYAAEYALQAGTWSAMGFPLNDVEARDRFYEFSNWMYQTGVFFSRSSGALFTAPIWLLWLMPGLQTLNLLFFCYVAGHAETSTILYQPAMLYAGAFYTGLLGGAVYISGYKRICADLPLAHREFALSATSVAEGLGIVVADALGLVIQGCLYQINGLEGAMLSCPFGS
jgi:battenin